MDNEFVTIAIFGDTLEADMAKMRLELEGIESFLENEHFSRAVPFSFSIFSLGGVKLQVRKNDVQEAIGILKEEQDSESQEV